MNSTDLKQKFYSIFNSSADATFFSPGRINLIGEHTDYNGGYVFPCAITLGTYGAARKRDDQLLRFYSANFPDSGIIQLSLDNLQFNQSHSWTNYPKGVIYFLQKAGYAIHQGMDIYVEGNIPNGAGLSSSASLEMLTGIIVQTLFRLTIDRIDIVKIGMQTENEFIGVQSGIMDQFAIGMGKDNHAILLNTNTLSHELVPLNLPEHAIIIMNTNKRRELADSKYNERRSECNIALSQLNQVLNIRTLGELNHHTFDEYNYLIKNIHHLKRARHAVWENQRTQQAKIALTTGDLAKFGRLMNASHVSLQYDYEVTGLELDTLVQAAWLQTGVVGARMTGAGFGGCAIAIVHKAHTDNFMNQVSSIYTEKIGYKPSFYTAAIASATCILAD